MRKFVRLFIMLLLAAALVPVPHVRGDVAYLPPEATIPGVRNDSEISGEDTRSEAEMPVAERIHGVYYINCPAGKAMLYYAPNSDQFQGELENGESVSAVYRHQDDNGIVWFYVAGHREGWIQAAYLSEAPAANGGHYIALLVGTAALCVTAVIAVTILLLKKLKENNA